MSEKNKSIRNMNIENVKTCFDIFFKNVFIFYVQHLTHSWQGPQYFRNLAPYLPLLLALHEMVLVIHLVIIFNWRCDWCPSPFSREIPCSCIINCITNVSLSKFYIHRFSCILRCISSFLNCLFLITFILFVTSGLLFFQSLIKLMFIVFVSGSTT